jgi:hypothetical protein
MMVNYGIQWWENIIMMWKSMGCFSRRSDKIIVFLWSFGNMEKIGQPTDFCWSYETLAWQAFFPSLLLYRIRPIYARSTYCMNSSLRCPKVKNFTREQVNAVYVIVTVLDMVNLDDFYCGAHCWQGWIPLIIVRDFLQNELC